MESVSVLIYVTLKLLHAVFGELDDKTINQIHGKASLSQYFIVAMLKLEYDSIFYEPQLSFLCQFVWMTK